jgi:hypothetical protein
VTGRPPPSVTRDLREALRVQAKKAGAQTPSVRGSDWRLATVTAVNADGTVDADGIPAIRRMEGYQAPVVGDLITISQSSSGNWVAFGRTATATDPVGAWTSLPLLAGYTTPQAAGFGVAQYRVLTVFGTARVELRGTAACTTALTAPTSVTSALPAAARPSVIRRLVIGRNYSATAIGAVGAEMSPAGVLQVFASTSPTTTWFSLDGCYYDL